MLDMVGRVRGTNKYALVVNSEMACEIRYPVEGTTEVEKITSILQSDPKIVLFSENPDEANINTYNLLVNDEVVGKFYWLNDGDTVPDPAMITAALKSDPKVIDITNIDPKPEAGWNWNGSIFINPNA